MTVFGFSEAYCEAVALRARQIAESFCDPSRAKGHYEIAPMAAFKGAVIERLAIEQALHEVSPEDYPVAA